MITSLARLFFPIAEGSCSKPVLNRAAGPTLCAYFALGSAPLARTAEMRIFALHNLGPAGSYARYADQEPQLCEAWCREPGGILPPRNNVSQVRHAVANNGREHFANRPE